MDKTERFIEFDKIKEIWAEFCLTDTAKKQVKEQVPLLSEAELLAKQRETTQGKKMMELCGNPPLVSLQGLEEIVDYAGKGDCLGIKQLLQVEMSLTAASRLKQYLLRGK